MLRFKRFWFICQYFLSSHLWRYFGMIVILRRYWVVMPQWCSSQFGCWSPIESHAHVQVYGTILGKNPSILECFKAHCLMGQSQKIHASYQIPIISFPYTNDFGGWLLWSPPTSCLKKAIGCGAFSTTAPPQVGPLLLGGRNLNTPWLSAMATTTTTKSWN